MAFEVDNNGHYYDNEENKEGNGCLVVEESFLSLVDGSTSDKVFWVCRRNSNSESVDAFFNRSHIEHEIVLRHELRAKYPLIVVLSRASSKYRYIASIVAKSVVEHCSRHVHELVGHLKSEFVALLKANS